MAQSRERRRRLVDRRSRRPAIDRMRRSERQVRLRRITIAFLVLLGLAGILALSPGGDGDGDRDGNGAPSGRTVSPQGDR